jgi:type III pantothenate kinase
MLLTADVGNTETVLGVFDGPELAQTWRLSTQPERSADELALVFAGLLEHRGLSLEKLSGLCIASVVPDVSQQLREMAARYLSFEPLIVGPGTRTGVSVLTDNPREVGADRIVNTLAAYTRFGGPAIVVDFGTGTNFDVVSEQGAFLGGVIAPGLQISAGALVQRTARLTRVEYEAPGGVIGTNTVDSIRSGLIFGTAGQVDGIVERIRLELGSATTIATGGLAPVVIPHCRTIDHHEPFLTLEGLRLVHAKNVDTHD